MIIRIKTKNVEESCFYKLMFSKFEEEDRSGKNDCELATGKNLSIVYMLGLTDRPEMIYLCINVCILLG